MQRSLGRLSMKAKEALLAIKDKIKSIIELSWLSVNRDNSEILDFDRRELFERYKNMVDVKLRKQAKELIVYQLQLESKVNTISTKFKEECLSLMLYNPINDVYNDTTIEQFDTVDTELMKTDLYKAFSVLGVVRDKSNLIQNHIVTIKKTIQKIKDNQPIDINDAFVLSLIKRTLSIINISKEHENQKKEIFKPMTDFVDDLKKFMNDKDFKFENGEVVINLKNQKDSSIDISSLSSGEKQLFILLTEALLQKEKPFLFIADEPELSLHIEWQRKILGEILKLNPSVQIIVATHSPEIAGNFPNNIINMKGITSYE